MSRSLLLAIAALSLFGAGCWKEPPKPAPAKAPSPASAPAPTTLQTDQTDEDPTDQAPAPTPSEELAAALARFRDLKSFRAKLALPNAKVAINGTIEVTKPERMRASLNLGGLQTMDIVIAGSSAYVRQDTDPWKDISASVEGRKLSAMLYGLTNGRTSLSSYAVKKDDNVTKAKDEDNACDRFDAKLKATDGTLKEILVCVSADGLVKYVQLQTPDMGPATFEYYDHNALFLIEKPI